MSLSRALMQSTNQNVSLSYAIDSNENNAWNFQRNFLKFSIAFASVCWRYDVVPLVLVRSVLSGFGSDRTLGGLQSMANLCSEVSVA